MNSSPLLRRLVAGALAPTLIGGMMLVGPQVAAAATGENGTVSASATALGYPASTQGRVGTALSILPRFESGTPPMTFAMEQGDLPRGLSFDPAMGLISGTPERSGNYSWLMSVTDATGAKTTQTISVSIAKALTFQSPNTWSTDVGKPFTYDLRTVGAAGAVTYSIRSGNLPEGVSFDAASGRVSGTPTRAENASVTFVATDSAGGTADRNLVFTVRKPTISKLHSDSNTYNPGTAVVLGNTVRLSTMTDQVPYDYNALMTSVVTFTATALTGPRAGQTFALDTVAVPRDGRVQWDYRFQDTGIYTIVAAYAGNAGSAGSASSPVTVEVKAASSFPEAGPELAIADPVSNGLGPADVGQSFQYSVAITGGQGRAQSTIIGDLPDGLTYDPSRALISGTPTAAGSRTITVRATDTAGTTVTRDITIIVRSVTTLSLTSQHNSNDPTQAVTPGQANPLTATVNGATNDAQGVVTYRATATTGPRTGKSFDVKVPVYRVGSATLAETMQTYAEVGTYDIVASYSGDSKNAGSASSPVSVQVKAAPGALVISEMRLSGQSGLGDEYAVLTNRTDAPLNISGWALSTTTGASSPSIVNNVPVMANGENPMPENTVIPARRSLLVAGNGYTLNPYATPDVTVAELGEGGLSVVAADPFATVVDAVGPAGADGYSEGTPLASLLTRAPTQQFAWVRNQQAGSLKDTGNNSQDFALVSTQGATVGGLPSILGSPNPTGLTTPNNQASLVTSALIDPSVSVNAAPNRVITKTPGVAGAGLQIRRLITNTSDKTVTSLRLRVIDLSQTGGLPSLTLPSSAPVANLTLLRPTESTVAVPVGGRTIQVNQLTPTLPQYTINGWPQVSVAGLNAAYAVPLPEGGLRPGQSIPVSFTLAASTNGQFWFRYNAEAVMAG